MRIRSRWFFIGWFVVLGLYFTTGLWWRSFRVWQYKETAIHQKIETKTAWMNAVGPYQASQLRGRIILLHFWNPCCESCKTVPRAIEDLQKEFDTKVMFLGAYLPRKSGKCSPSNFKEAVVEFGIHYPVTDDSDEELAKLFKVDQAPAIILVNPDGKVEASGFGKVTKEQIEQSIFHIQKKYLDYRT